MKTNLTCDKSPREIWDAVLGELELQVNKPNFRTWFSKTCGLSYADNHFVVGVPNNFVGEYLEQNQRSLIEKALIGLTGAGVKFSFQVNGKSHHGDENINNMPGINIEVHKYSSLNPQYIFDSFIEGPCNKLARNAALSVTQNPGHTYNPLFIYGGSGLGKTHLLHAIGQAALATRMNVICTSAEQFTNEFVTALRDRSTEEFRNKYRSIGILLIDDIQFISGKEGIQESFFHTFNELHNTNRQIVMTSDRSPKDMSLLEERLRTRFEWGLTVDIQPPDFETRLSILKYKANQKGVSIDPSVLEYVAGRSQRNIRELEGSLNRVIAFARLLKAIPDVDLATKALQDIAAREPMRDSVTTDSIIQAVAINFNLSPDDLKGRKRDKDTSLARRIAMYILRQETNFSLAQIGQELGSRDAAAVTTACKGIAGDVDSSPYLKRKLDEIQATIHPAGK
jgi:chromosomal replication initiator protein